MVSHNKQLAINIFASFTTYFVQFAINLILTPYIVKSLGVEAYGFVTLSTQIIGYTSLITIALNSMAGRFISIEYYKGNIHKANLYFSSVFISNLFISALIFILSVVLVINLDIIIDIPQYLISDVKWLFLCLSVNTILGILSNVYAVSTFIKNRLDYANIRNIIGNLIRALILSGSFMIFAPKIWYFGFTSIICTIYLFIINYRFCNKLTPDLKVSQNNWDIRSVKELIISGVWNVVSKLSQLLENGFNILIANVFLGAQSAGLMALSVTVPTMINSICATLAQNFAPSWTKLYAEGAYNDILIEILKSIRIMGFIASIPIAFFICFGEMFFSLWVPTENAFLLYWLAIAGSFVMAIAMPLETLWNIFTITNQVKKASLNLLEWSVVMFISVLVSMFIVEDITIRLFLIASIKSILASIRTLTFLTIQSAKLLNFPKVIFYPPILKNIVCILFICISTNLICGVLNLTGWNGIFIGGLITFVLGIVINASVVLTKGDRAFLLNKIRVISSPK